MQTTADRLDNLARDMDRLLAEAGAADLTREHTPDRLASAADHLAESAARLAGGEYRPAYNGWLNRETWNAALWIGNDSGTDAEARAIVADALTVDPFAAFAAFTGHRPHGEDAESIRAAQLSHAADALREWWSETMTEPYNLDDAESSDALPGPLSDAWTYAAAVTHWYTIAEAYAEE